MKAGILRVSKEVADAARAALPAGHTILTVTDIDLVGQEEWLIAGPHMPDCVGDKPETVTLLLHREMVDGQVAVTAWWHHLPGVTWPVPVS